MPDVFSKEKRSEVMSRIKSKNTSIELLVRKWLFAKGFRYRINVKSLPGKPDIVMKKYDTAIFINGCYWHGHGDCYYSHEASTNKEYWKPKIENNKIRDEKHQKELEELGFKVYIIWECEIRKRLNETLEILIGKIQSH